MRPEQAHDPVNGHAGPQSEETEQLRSSAGNAVPAPDSVPVIGIGASAGGIEALSSFFEVMPADSGCAFVVVLHLDPKRESALAHILGTHTAMPVLQVEDGMQLAANHVYVIAPDTDLEVSGGALHVSTPRDPHGQRHPVDVLFSSLAADQRERAIAIVLSGIGSNGTEGLRAIRAEGGMSLVQKPETAKFDGMPRSAILADMADHVLAPENMPETLLAYLHHGYVATAAGVEATSPIGRATLGQLLELLRARGGHDFHRYKESTLGRRAHRRLGLRNIDTLDAYLDDLRTSPAEVTALVVNEDLETSKEELQSFNEELNTVNSQLRYKIGELETTTNNLNNLLADSEVATLFLDAKFRIRWFALATKDLFDFVASDIGRPIAHLARKFSDDNLLQDIETVLDKLARIEAEVSSDAGRWYTRRVLPYRTQDNRIAGVVVTFNDITERKRAADSINDARIYAETIVRTVQHPLLVLDRKLHVQSANKAFSDLFVACDEDPKGHLIFELGTDEWNTPPLRGLLERVLTEDEDVNNFEFEQDFQQVGQRSMRLTARKLPQDGGRDDLIVVDLERDQQAARRPVMADRAPPAGLPSCFGPACCPSRAGRPEG